MPVMVQLLFDVYHVPSRLVVLPVVTFSEFLEVTKFRDPRPRIVWKEKRKERGRKSKIGERDLSRVSTTN